MIAGIVVAQCLSGAAAALGKPDLLLKADSAYFMEDDLVYARFFWFQADGRYRQINRDRSAAEEVDRGTWEQTGAGEIVLHPTHGMLLFRALSAGPLLVMLDTQGRIDSLPTLRGKIVSFLQSYQDPVFARGAVSELVSVLVDASTPPMPEFARVDLPPAQDTFERSDLEKLLHLIDVWLESKSRNSFVFDRLAESSTPDLLIQRGAVYSATELAATRSRCVTNPSTPPPFYFARIDRRTFVSRVGRWKPFVNLGGTDSHDPVPLKSP